LASSVSPAPNLANSGSRVSVRIASDDRLGTG
jgi:hypothetical protein